MWWPSETRNAHCMLCLLVYGYPSMWFTLKYRCILRKFTHAHIGHSYVTSNAIFTWDLREKRVYLQLHELDYNKFYNFVCTCALTSVSVWFSFEAFCMWADGLRDVYLEYYFDSHPSIDQISLEQTFPKHYGPIKLNTRTWYAEGCMHGHLSPLAIK